MVFYGRNLSDEMKDVLARLTNIVNSGEIIRGYNILFRSSSYTNSDNNSLDVISSQLDLMFQEVQDFEMNVKNSWNVSS